MTNFSRLRALGSLARTATRWLQQVSDSEEDERPYPSQQQTRRNGQPMDPWMEPDWEEMDKKANMIVARYAIVSSAWNVLPPPFDLMGVAATFAKMATELAGVYQVIVSNSRARQMGWAIATTTASVLGVAYAGSRLVKLIPGVSWLAALLVQAPIVGAVTWAAGDALREYFKQTRHGVDPGLAGLKDLFAKTLHLKLKPSAGKRAKADGAVAAAAGKNGATSGAAAATEEPANSAGDVVEKIAGLHELMRQGAITQEEFDKKKTDLLSQM